MSTVHTKKLCSCGSGLHGYTHTSLCAYCQIELRQEHIAERASDKPAGYTKRNKEDADYIEKASAWLFKHGYPLTRVLAGR